MTDPVSLISRWFLKPGCETAAEAALRHLAREIQAGEPRTLAYLVHRPAKDPPRPTLPPDAASSVVFFEIYESAEAFRAHVEGPIFRKFTEDCGAFFIDLDGQPFRTVEFLDAEAGFIRPGAFLTPEPSPDPERGVNQHPAVMFEFIAKDLPAMTQFYSRVFGWRYRTGTSGFHYVHFVAGSPPLLGGLGQADPTKPGFSPGHNFYLAVDRVEPVLDAAVAAGGSPLMPPTAADGYRFAMFRDPEGNPVGLIEPFAN